MTTQDTRQLALDHFKRINEGDIAGATAMVADDCINHGALPEAQGRAGLTTILTKMRTAFPDMRLDVQGVIGEGDRVAVRVTFSGTHTGPLTMVRLPLAPTNKTVKVDQIHVLRAANGKLVEAWFGNDALSMFRQLGVQIVQS